jgi:glycine/D-amino acid oxidase-like deaminating enzyme
VNLRPYWWDTVPLPDETPHEAPLPPRVDAVVVGAGYTGLSAARRLAMCGASVLVVERETIGWGASSRNGGQVLTGLAIDSVSLLRAYGRRRARALFRAASDALNGLEELIQDERIDCGFERTGHVQAAWKRSHFESLREEQAVLAREFDHHVRIVDRQDQQQEIGSDRFHGVLVDDRSAALNPAQYVRGLARAAQARGVRIVTGVSVLETARDGDVWRIGTTAGAVTARDVLFATYGYTDGAFPELRRRIVPVGSYIVATEPLDAETAASLVPRRRMAFDSKYFLYYFRVTGDRRLLFGGRAEFRRPDAHSVGRAASILRRGLNMVFPRLADVRIDYAWGGNVAFARDRMPHAGQLAQKYFAAGYGGHGIAIATALGDAIARQMAGQMVEHPMFEDSMPAIPLYRGRPWFLPFVGAYYAAKDWLS